MTEEELLEEEQRKFEEERERERLGLDPSEEEPSSGVPEEPPLSATARYALKTRLERLAQLKEMDAKIKEREEKLRAPEDQPKPRRTILRANGG